MAWRRRRPDVAADRARQYAHARRARGHTLMPPGVNHGMTRDGRPLRGGEGVPPDHCSRLTPREMTRTESSSAETDSVPIRSLARGESGMVSVGLNAEELVTEMYR
jgi:hypothetical protein